jgi:hypothetical protein
MTTAITKFERPRDSREDYLHAMWSLFLRCNADPQPDATGAFVICDEPGFVREKNWERLTPYSIARPL